MGAEVGRVRSAVECVETGRLGAPGGVDGETTDDQCQPTIVGGKCSLTQHSTCIHTNHTTTTRTKYLYIYIYIED